MLDQYWAQMDCMHEDGRFGHMCVQVCVCNCKDKQ